MTAQTTTSIAELQQKAQAGDAQAQFDLALCYANGDGVEKDEVVAFEWHKQAAELGHVDAQFALGLFYFIEGAELQPIFNKWVAERLTNKGFDLAIRQVLSTELTQADHALAFKWLKIAAEKKHIEAQYYLALCYFEGKGVEQNHDIAFEKLEKAAKDNIIEAQDKLARCYRDGNGVGKNESLAFEWFKKAADADFAEAQLELGRFYTQGIGVEKNAKLAFEYLKKAAEQNLAEAQYCLAQAYEHGTIVKEDLKLAFEWGHKAAELGHEKAMHWISEQYSDIGKYYFLGKGIAKNYKTAIEYFTQAAEFGSADANAMLSHMYETGKGVDKNDEIAFKYLKTAVENYEHADYVNNEELRAQANLLLADFYKNGKGCEKNISLAEEINLRISPNVRKKMLLENIVGIMELPATSEEARENILLRLSICLSSKAFDLAEEVVGEAFKNAEGVEKKYESICRIAIEQAKEITQKNQELEEKKQELQQAQNGLEETMAMFAHKFRSPLDAILYNTSHEHQPKLYIQATQTMQGLLDIFSTIATDAEHLQERLVQDNQGNGNLMNVLTKTLDMILLHLLSVSASEKIQQHYVRYAKANGLCPNEINDKQWNEDYFELEQQLQAEWEHSFAQLLNQSPTLQQRLAWFEPRFFKLELQGFDTSTIQFRDYGITESFLTILLNEILVNAFKYYASDEQQAVVLAWTEQTGYQVLSCRNPCTDKERSKLKGSGKGHTFLSALARKSGSQFTKPKVNDEFVLEFGIANQLLITS